jgi:hypothetical protein
MPLRGLRRAHFSPVGSARMPPWCHPDISRRDRFPPRRNRGRLQRKSRVAATTIFLLPRARDEQRVAGRSFGGVKQAANAPDDAAATPINNIGTGFHVATCPLFST